jgi:hypothetical protein
VEINPMKRTLAALLLALTSLAQAAAPEADFFVSPKGDDNASGSLKAPFATIDRAQSAVRALRQTKQGPITVMLREGVYSIASPLAFTPADSGTPDAPIVWAAYPGETPVVSGGRVLTGWQETEDGLWSLQIPEVASGDWFFWQLFQDGQRLLRCREPDEGYFRSEGPFIPRPQRGSKEWKDDECRIGFFFKDGDLKAWDDATSGSATVFQSWTASVHWLASVDEAKHELRFTKGSGWPMGYWEKNQRYYIENVRAALDEPGEWYLNRETGLCLYKPRKGEKIADFQPVAPVAPQLLTVEGDLDAGVPAGNLTFRGISFQHSTFDLPYSKSHDGQAGIALTGAIYTKDAVNVRFEDIELAHVGTYGVWFAKGTRDSVIIRSELHDLGAGGVKIGETGNEPTEATACRNNLVENCFIHDGGHLCKAGIGVWIGRSSYHTARRNEICDFDYSGVSVGWSWGYAPSSANHNIIEYNHIHHIGNGVLSDMGGIYCLGKSPGTILRGNIMHDIASYSYGGWGLYTDEGSTGILMEKNIVYNTKSGGFHQHYGEDNTLRHNILAFAREGQVIRSRQEEHLSFTFDHNIVIFENGMPLGKNYTNGNYKFDYNLYWDVSGKPFLFAGYDFEEWQEEGQDVHSLIADPLFRDARGYDFRLSKKSPAYALGIEPLQDFSKVGLYGPRSWTRKPTKVTHRTLDPSRKPPQVGTNVRRNPREITENCDELKVGDKVAFAGTSGEDNGASIRVAANPDGKGNVLKFQDAPGLQFEWQPHLSAQLSWNRGAVKASFDVLMGDGAEFWHEWRDRSGPYQVGPNLRFKAGALYSGDTKLCDVPVGKWIHVEMECPLDDGTAKGTFDLTVSIDGGKTQLFSGPCKLQSAKWRTLNTMVWVSNATDTSEFYLDNIHYQRIKAAK